MLLYGPPVRVVAMDEVVREEEALYAHGAGPGVVLQVLKSLDPGPDCCDALALASAFQAVGKRMLVVGDSGSFHHEFKRRDAEVLELPLNSRNPWRLYRNAKSLLQIIQEKGVELVHAHDPAPGWSAAMAARQAGVPLVTTVHDLPDQGNFIQNRFNSIMTGAAKVIAPAACIVERLGGDSNGHGDAPAASHIELVRGGIDLNIFDPARVSAERVIALSNSWRLHDDKLLILMPGRPEGYDLLLQALQGLKDLSFTCVFVSRYGEISELERQAIESAISRAGLEDRAFVAEPCRDMAAALKLADVVALPSQRNQGFRRIIAEAQALGCPVVALDVGGADEQIEDGRTGFLVSSGKSIDFSMALRQALSLSSDIRERLLEDAILSVRGRYDQDRMTMETLDLYSDAFAGHQSVAGRAQLA